MNESNRPLTPGGMYVGGNRNTVTGNTVIGGSGLIVEGEDSKVLGNFSAITTGMSPEEIAVVEAVAKEFLKAQSGAPRKGLADRLLDLVQKAGPTAIAAAKAFIALHHGSGG